VEDIVSDRVAKRLNHEATLHDYRVILKRKSQCARLRAFSKSGGKAEE
jgi:hypothetical protein